MGYSKRRLMWGREGTPNLQNDPRSWMLALSHQEKDQANHLSKTLCLTRENNVYHTSRHKVGSAMWHPHTGTVPEQGRGKKKDDKRFRLASERNKAASITCDHGKERKRWGQRQCI